MPVSVVHPPARRISAVAAAESASNITPAPAPTPFKRGREHGQHQHRGDDDLVRRNGNDVREQDHAVQSDQQAERIRPVDEMLGQRRRRRSCTFATSQITTPAGTANTIARQSTKTVRSISDV